VVIDKERGQEGRAIMSKNVALKKSVQVLRVVVASPGDVQAERDAVEEVLREVNRGVAEERNLLLTATRWEKDAFPGFHREGPQGLIDSILRIPECDIFVGILWKRFGTAMSDAKSGTQHEYQLAYETWKKNGRPQIFFYFNKKPYSPTTAAELDQWRMVLEFQEGFPKEGLWWPYKSKASFKELLRNHLESYLRKHFSLEGEEPLSPEELIQEALCSGALSLDLRSLGLTEVPESLGQLVQLWILSLSDNQLTELPGWLCQLTELQHLDLSANRFAVLPQQLAQLTRLRTLVLSSNCLTALPEFLRKLPSLEKLYLHGNEALGLPSDVLGPTWEDITLRQTNPPKPAEILDYYFQIRSGSRHLNEAKLILVGPGGVGKTCIVNCLVGDRFDPNEPMTDGIRITQWMVTLNAKEDVRLNIWEFGGQKIMHSTHQFFLTQRSLYVLVLNGRTGGEDTEAEYWLQLIESFGGESPVIVVLNKIKEYAFDLNRRALQQKFPGIRAFVRTDCRDQTGLAELTAAIQKETDRLDGLHDRFPASWFKIKDRLAGLTEDFLSFERYRQLCEELGERNPVAQEHLAASLHRLGIALNFKDDPRLRDSVVLNPRWITNGIYKILNSNQLAQQKGIFRLTDLTSLLDPKDYPTTRHLFLLNLMEKFELCFGFPDDPQHRYLFPELLDNIAPDIKVEFQPEKCLNFEYHYNIVPEGLLPRFIVRTNILSATHLRWRSGVMLEFEGNQALVKADARNRKITISVAGPLEGRRRLLAVIRSDFEAIHGDIRKLQVAEMVPVKGHPEIVIPYTKLKVMEQKRVARFPEVIGNETVELDVGEMLNGVDLEGTHPRSGVLERGDPLRVFISYSHKDETLRAELETHLKLLQRQGLIAVWSDRRIDAGEEWRGKIDDNLDSARMILLLVSADFIGSDYCYDVEMTRALARQTANEARVIPIILRAVHWQPAPFGKLQALPKDGKPVTLWENKDSAWKDVSTGIRIVAERMSRKM